MIIEDSKILYKADLLIRRLAQAGPVRKRISLPFYYETVKETGWLPESEEAVEETLEGYGCSYHSL